MRPVTFDWRAKPEGWERHDFGMIAEEFARVDPLFVTYNAQGQIEGIRYMQFTAVLVKAVQELKADNDNLAARLDAANDNLAAEHTQDAKAIDELRREIADLERKIAGH